MSERCPGYSAPVRLFEANIIKKKFYSIDSHRYASKSVLLS